MRIEDILESLNFTSPIEWKDSIGYFNISDQEFVVQVRPANHDEEQTFVPFFDTLPKVGNVDFSAVLPDGKMTQDLTGLSGNSVMKVFSVVAQGVEEQIDKHGYEILLCVAKSTASPTNFNKRVQAYETITDRAARKSGMHQIILSSTKDTTLFVVYHPKYVDNMIQIKNHLSQHYKD